MMVLMSAMSPQPPSAPPSRASRLGLLAATVLFGTAVAWTALAVAHAAHSGDADFFILRESAQLHAMGDSAYGRMPGSIVVPEDTDGNLNHPVVVALLIPFTWVPADVGFFLWTALSIGAGLLTLMLAGREMGMRWSPRSAVITGAAFAAFPGVGICLDMGQIGLLLGLGVTASWVLIRRQRWLAAGAVVGALIALKLFFIPLLAVFLVRRNFWALGAAAGGAAAICLAAVPVVGLDAYEQWVNALVGVTWFDHALNTSLPGLVSRLGDGTIGGVALYGIAAAVISVAGAVVLRRPPHWVTREDRDVVVLVVACLLASPLGWLYYLPMFVPAVAVLARAWRALRGFTRLSVGVAAAMLWVPYLALPHFPATGPRAALGGWHTYGMILLFIVLAGGTSGSAESKAPASVGRDRRIDLPRIGVDPAVQ